MTADFVPYQEALELKALGFDEPCFTYYKNDQLSDILELVKNSEMENVNNEVHDYISTPTFSQAFRWFREKYGWIAEIDGSLQFNHFYANLLLQAKGEVFNIKMCDTYEEAELVCLRKLIEIVKSQKE